MIEIYFIHCIISIFRVYCTEISLTICHSIDKCNVAQIKQMNDKTEALINFHIVPFLLLSSLSLASKREKFVLCWRIHSIFSFHLFLRSIEKEFFFARILMEILICLTIVHENIYKYFIRTTYMRSILFTIVSHLCCQ